MPPRAAANARIGLTSPGSLSGLALLLILAGLLAWFASATPRALAPDAPASRFSAGRAMRDVEALAAVPHPIGSAANARVRDGLLARLRSLGLQPQVTRTAGVRPWGAPHAPPVTVEDVSARLPGVDRTAPALLVMSHYDSVPGSPGAADDMAAVASALEIARLLRAGPPPVRDVLFLFTDGEEAGLAGAEAFFADPAASRGVGFVLNMDTRGGGGRALMFQTGRDAGAAVRLFAAQARLPVSNSLAAFLYEVMPNDTDFTVALAHGLPGLNYAFIGRPALYHTAIAVPAAVERGAVQSLGEQVWAMTRALAAARSLPPPQPSPTWFDLFGRWVLVYPPALGWAPLLAGALVLAGAVRTAAGAGEAGAGDLLAGAAQSLGAACLAAAALLLYGRLGLGLGGHGSGRALYYGALAHAGRTEAASALAVLGAGLLAFRLGPAPARPCGRWAGALALALVLALALQLVAPRAAFLAQWPMLVGALALLAEVRGGPGRAAALPLCALALGFLLETWFAVVLGVGLLSPAVAAALAPIGYPLASPWLQRPARARAPGVSSSLF